MEWRSSALGLKGSRALRFCGSRVQGLGLWGCRAWFFGERREGGQGLWLESFWGRRLMI